MNCEQFTRIYVLVDSIHPPPLCPTSDHFILYLKLKISWGGGMAGENGGELRKEIKRGTKILKKRFDGSFVDTTFC